MNQLKRLIVVAGPSAVGKSVLLQALKQAKAESSTGNRILGIAASDSWAYFRAGALENPRHLGKTHAVLHYDLCRKRRRRDDLSEGRLLAQRVAMTDDLVFVTLWEQPGILTRRVWDRTVHGGQVPLGKRGLRSRNNHRYRNLGKLLMYGLNPGRLWKHYYQDWFGFCGRFSSREHWVVRTSNPDNWVSLRRYDLDRPFWSQAEPVEPDLRVRSSYSATARE